MYFPNTTKEKLRQILSTNLRGTKNLSHQIDGTRAHPLLTIEEVGSYEQLVRKGNKPKTVIPWVCVRVKEPTIIQSPPLSQVKQSCPSLQ
jgi:hypothetical protein